MDPRLRLAPSARTAPGRLCRGDRGVRGVLVLRRCSGGVRGAHADRGGVLLGDVAVARRLVGRLRSDTPAGSGPGRGSPSPAWRWPLRSPCPGCSWPGNRSVARRGEAVPFHRTCSSGLAFQSFGGLPIYRGWPDLGPRLVLVLLYGECDVHRCERTGPGRPRDYPAPSPTRGSGFCRRHCALPGARLRSPRRLPGQRAAPSGPGQLASGGDADGAGHCGAGRLRDGFHRSQGGDPSRRPLARCGICRRRSGPPRPVVVRSRRLPPLAASIRAHSFIWPVVETLVGLAVAGFLVWANRRRRLLRHQDGAGRTGEGRAGPRSDGQGPSPVSGCWPFRRPFWSVPAPR